MLQDDVLLLLMKTFEKILHQSFCAISLATRYRPTEY